MTEHESSLLNGVCFLVGFFPFLYFPKEETPGVTLLTAPYNSKGCLHAEFVHAQDDGCLFFFSVLSLFAIRKHKQTALPFPGNRYDGIKLPEVS